MPFDIDAHTAGAGFDYSLARCPIGSYIDGITRVDLSIKRENVTISVKQRMSIFVHESAEMVQNAWASNGAKGMSFKRRRSQQD